MNNTKKTVCIIVGLAILLLSVGLISSFAAGEPAYALDGCTVETGGSFSMTVKIKDNPGLISLNLDVEYDGKVLKLESVENLGLLSGFTNPAPEISSPYTLRWSDSLGVDNSKSGDIVKLNFKVLSSTDTDTTVRIIHNNAFSSNGDGKNIAFKNAEAKVSVRTKYTVTFYGEDGSTVISSAKYFPGETLVLPEDPVKANDENSKYSFDKWSPELVTAVNASASYTASFTETPLSDDASLESLTVDGVTLAPTFDPDTLEYTASVEYGISSLEVACIASSEFSSVTLEGTELSVGENTLKVTVTAEKGNTRVYTLKVTRQRDPSYVESSDALFESLIPSHGVLTPAFDSNCKSYLLYVENASESVSFVCTPRNDKIRDISDSSEHILTSDRTEITLFCVAENGDRVEYTLTVVRLPRFEGEIPEFVIGAPPKGDDSKENEGKDPSTGNSGNNNDGNSEKNEKNDVEGKTDKVADHSKTAVIVIIAVAALLAAASVIGIVLLVISGKKKAEANK